MKIQAQYANEDNQAREFFSWPENIKQSALRPAMGPYRGYAPVGFERISAITNHMKGESKAASSNASKDIKDMKETFDMGPENDATWPTAWPQGGDLCTAYREFMRHFYRDCTTAHDTLLAVFEEALGLPKQELLGRVSDANGEIRLTHYPPISPTLLGQEAATYRIAEHTDVGVLTLLFQDSVGGLEIEDYSKPGSFRPVASEKLGEMIVNIADTLQMWTASSLRSTNHRVLCPTNFSKDEMLPARYSIGYFGKANATAPMAPLAGFQHASGEAEIEPGATAQNYYNMMHEKTSASVSPSGTVVA